MGRQVIHLDVRADTAVDTTEALEQVAALVGSALNCTFAEGEYQRWYAQVALVFGLKLSLAGRSGIGGKQVAKLVSNIAEPGLKLAPDGSGPIEQDRVDISGYIADLLTVRTGLQWYLPTAEDRRAEAKAAFQFDEQLRGGAGGSWSSADEERFGDW
jgi:hypothetical protein